MEKTKKPVFHRMRRTMADIEASCILAKVAKAANRGQFPPDVTCEQIGQALEQICFSSHEDDPLLEILSGYRKSESERQRLLRVIAIRC